MKFFIDTANLAQIKEAADLGVLDGVTTNPSLMAKEGIKGDAAVLEHYKKICDLMERDKFMSPEEAKELGLIDKIICFI